MKGTFLACLTLIFCQGFIDCNDEEYNSTFVVNERFEDVDFNETLDRAETLHDGYYPRAKSNAFGWWNDQSDAQRGRL